MIQNVSVYVEGEEADSFSELSLQPGEERELIVENYIVPANLSSLTEYSMEISVDGDRTPADNLTTFKVGYPDINVDTSVRFVEGHNWFDIVVNNSTDFTTDGTLKIYKESLEGEVIAETELTDKDYEIEGYEYNDGQGTALPDTADLPVGTELKVKITGIKNYTGTAEAVYKVAQKDISKLKITISSQPFTGKEITFTEADFGTKIKVTGKRGEELPVYGTDYIITGYTKNINKGKATVTFKGISDTWGGSKTVTFNITQKKLKWFLDLLF